MSSASSVLEITCYTDPLCSWSWALEPAWRRLRGELGPGASVRYCMGGLIPDWSRYSDPVNDVSTPAQMGPQWLYVSEITGVELDPAIWHDDPPASSYPACLAVKAASLQGSGTGERFLRRAREAVMLERRNVARRDVLLALGRELAAGAEREGDAPGAGFDFTRFETALDDGSALDALRRDIDECRARGVERFPTLVVRRAGEPEGLLLAGYRPYEALRGAVETVRAGRDGAPPT